MWATVTEPQAIIISAILTIAAAVVGVILGSMLFGNRVRDLQTALDSASALVNDHRDEVDRSLASIRQKLDEFEQNFSTTTEMLGQLRGSVSDISATVEFEDEAKEASREQVRQEWELIRDRLEEIAADPRIDGRRRAKYARVDRRSYATLVRLLDDDGELPHRPFFDEAVGLWNQLKTGRREPQAEELRRMQQLRQRLVP